MTTPLRTDKLVSDQTRNITITTVGSYETKTHLPQLLEKVAKGEQITITKHGVPIAKIVPIMEGEPMDRHAAIQKLQELSKGVTRGGLSIREMINEGRKY